jgi:demethylmenaquinone methyltransferase/2-methoxy-6-polyprenyl-1,4-benzoquinol methylase
MDSPVARLLFRLMARVMESPLRYRFFDPARTLRAARIQPGLSVLEIGPGTGFFTIPAAELLGDGGRLYSVDPHPLAIEQVLQKIRYVGQTNVRLVRADATRAGLSGGCVDLVLLFGIIPSPVVPLGKLLPEIHRVLRPSGSLAVWTAIPGWSPASLARSGLFVPVGGESGVHSFRRVERDPSLSPAAG